MINSKDYDFSFSGLKTAVLYLIRDLKEKNPNILDDIKINQNRLGTNNQLSLQVGIGRIEDVSDARTAIYILEDLYKQGRLSRILNQEEVFEFANFFDDSF